MFESGWEVLLEVREWSSRPSKCPVVVGSTSQMSESGREDFPDVR